MKPIILTVLIILVPVSGFVWLFWPQYEALTIKDLSWERYIDVYQYNTVKEISSYLPTEGRLIRTHTTAYVSVDMDGGSHLEVDTDYEYWIERWQPYKTYEAHYYDKNPYWPTYTLSPATLPYNAGQQRVQQQRAYYRVFLVDSKNNLYETKCDQERWEKLEKEQIVYVTMFRWGGIIKFHEMEAIE